MQIFFGLSKKDLKKTVSVTMASINNNFKLSVAPDKFILEDLLGAGSYGKVYKVTTENKTQLVTKMISCLIDDGISDISEIDVMSRLVHPNLTPSNGVKGICSNDSDFYDGRRNNIDSESSVIYNRQIAIFMEMASTTLLQYVVGTSTKLRTLDISKVNDVGTQADMDEKTILLYQVCKGTKFLHSNNILHLDIKPENILIFVQNGVSTAKLSDFGNCVYINSSGQRCINKELTTITYRAPESFNYPTIYGKHSDVWSLGIVILYTILGSKILFRDYRKTREDIYRIFGNKNKISFLRDKLASIDLPYQYQYIDLLDKMLTIKLVDRISLDQVLRQPIFDFSHDGHIPNNDDGYVLCPVVNPVTRSSILYYRGFDYLIRTCLSVDDSI